MAKQSISISLESALLQALDGELRHSDSPGQQNRSAAVTEALELWLERRRLEALRQAYHQLAGLEGGDLEAAAMDAETMGTSARAGGGARCRYREQQPLGGGADQP